MIKTGSLWQDQKSELQQPVIQITKVEEDKVWYIILDEGWNEHLEPKPLRKDILLRSTELSKPTFLKMVLKGEYESNW